MAQFTPKMHQNMFDGPSPDLLGELKCSPDTLAAMRDKGGGRVERKCKEGKEGKIGGKVGNGEGSIV